MELAVKITPRGGAGGAAAQADQVRFVGRLTDGGAGLVHGRSSHQGCR